MLARQLTCTPGLFRCRFFFSSSLPQLSLHFTNVILPRMRFMCKWIVYAKNGVL